MKIKVALLDDDKNYLNRITSAFTNKYMDKLEIYSFSKLELALESLDEKKIDVFLASEEYEINAENIPKRCGFAYFVSGSGVEEIYGQRAICKYQKAELIYRQILGIFADVSSGIAGVKFDNDVNVITFFGCSGGVGSSSLAAAYARRMAKKGKKVLYLNTERLGNSEYFFSGEGNQTFSDVLYAIKSQKTNLSIKLESSIREDSTGVRFYQSSAMAMDIVEMAVEDFRVLLNTVKTTMDYEFIIIDAELTMDDMFHEISKNSTVIIIVGDGSEISNEKLVRLCDIVKIIEEQKDERIIAKMKLIYNKFSNKTNNVLRNIEIAELGGIQKYEHATTKQILELLESKGEILDKIHL